MNCDPLPNTGGPSGWLLLAAGFCLFVGAAVLLRRGGHRGIPAVLAVVLLICVGAAITDPSSSQAASAGCSNGGISGDGSTPPVINHALKVTQTSVMAGLAPGVAPASIFGRVTNTSVDATYVTTVTVSITSVTLASGAPAGTCSAADYVLANPVMTVNQPLPAHSAVTFAGATIGFASSASVQDACKSATIQLHYVTGSK
jgi:LPXTG-motif cell wall-anchored protein